MAICLTHFPNGRSAVLSFSDRELYIGYTYLSDYARSAEQFLKMETSVCVELTEMSEDKKELWFEYK